MRPQLHCSTVYYTKKSAIFKILNGFLIILQAYSEDYLTLLHVIL